MTAPKPVPESAGAAMAWQEPADKLGGETLRQARRLTWPGAAVILGLTAAVMAWHFIPPIRSASSDEPAKAGPPVPVVVTDPDVVKRLDRIEQKIEAQGQRIDRVLELLADVPRPPR